jgi:hypothetical protein
MVRENLKAAQSRQRSYADARRRELSFEVGDYVYLKVSPIRGTKRFGFKGKLAPRYIGRIRFKQDMEKWLINSSYQRIYLLCTMCSMCLS